MATKDDSRILLTSWDSRIEILIGQGDEHVFDIVEGANKPDLKVKLVRRDGTEVTTIDSATVTMKKQKSGAIKVAAQSMVVNGTGPELDYTFGSSEVDEAAIFKARITIVHVTSGDVEPIPEVIRVRVKKAYN